MHFAQIPLGVPSRIRALGGGNTAVLAYVALRMYLREEGQRWRVRLRVLADAAGTSLASMRRGLAWLQVHGLLAVHPVYREDGGRGANAYTLHLWPEASAADAKAKATETETETPRAQLIRLLCSANWTSTTARNVQAFISASPSNLRAQVRKLKHHYLWPATARHGDLLAALAWIAAEESANEEEDSPHD